MEAPDARLWLRLPGFFNKSDVMNFLAEATSSSPRCVTVGHQGHTWSERDVGRQSQLYKAMTSSDLLTLVWPTLGYTFPWKCQVWSNVYEEGEQIPWHKDVHGDIHILICLRPAPDGCGGCFQIRDAEAIVTVPLTAGDILIFQASQIEHRVTQLSQTTQYQNPQRIVAVARFINISKRNN